MKKSKKGKRPPKAPKPRKKRQPTPKVRSAGVPAAAASDSGPSVNEVLGGAAAALQAGRPGDAMLLCREILAQEPDNADALNLAGVAAFQLGDAAEARSLIETAVAFRPDFADALNNLGNVLKAEGDRAAAEDAYRRALRARPGYLDAEYNLGIALEAQGRFADAEASYRRCLAADKDFAPAHFNLGNVLKALGRLDKAEKAYRDAIERQPSHAEAWSNLGTVLAELSRPADAIHAYREAIGLDAGFADAHYNLGIALQEQRDFEDAIGCYDLALAGDPGHAGAQINIGYALKEMGRLADAEEAYRKAIDMAPGYDKVHANLGDLYLEQGKPDAALELCDGFLAEHPGNISVLAFKAIALQEAGRDADARALLDFDRLLRPTRVTVPQGFADMAAFNRALSDHVLAHPSLMYAPASHATRLGRHSGELLVEPKGPVAALEDAIMAAVRDYRDALPPDPAHPYLARRPEKLGLSVWGVVMDSQGHQIAHIHPSAWLSGVYYPKVPVVVGADDADHSGWIEFGRAPEDFHAAQDPAVRLILPEEGLMLLFPSYFYHRTVPFESDDPRISIAFDVLGRD